MSEQRGYPRIGRRRARKASDALAEARRVERDAYKRWVEANVQLLDARVHLQELSRGRR